MSEINLKIVTPKEILFQGTVSILTIKTINGYIGLMEKQIPFISFIKPCRFEINGKDSNGNKVDKKIAIGDGIIYNSGSEIEIITKDVIDLEKTSLSKAREELENLKNLLIKENKNSSEYSKIDNSIAKKIKEINLLEN